MSLWMCGNMVFLLEEGRSVSLGRRRKKPVIFTIKGSLGISATQPITTGQEEGKTALGEGLEEQEAKDHGSRRGATGPGEEEKGVRLDR